MKKDFVSRTVSFSSFKSELQKYWPKFIAHHNDAKWHDNDFIALKNKLRQGKVGLVIDYSENYSHEPRFEHQSKYFSQVQTTIIPVVLMFRVEDLENVTADERSELITMFDEFKLPHIISETHFVISSDMQHDNAMVQKLLDDLIMPYIKMNAPSVSELHVRSDGCKAQFKCASNFYWVSRQSVDGSMLSVNWSFFESCHGKCYCDPEGGTLKNAARHHELNVSDPTKQLKDSESLYKWAQYESGLSTPKQSLKHKKGKGIYRRFFYWIPSKGTGAVDRSHLPKLKAEGTSKLHEFVDVGVIGTVSTRRASCHQCDACLDGHRFDCVNKAYVGEPTELKITHEMIPSAAAQRIDRAAVNRDSLARAQLALQDSNICVETHKDEQSYPWVIGLVVTALQPAPMASAPYDPATDLVHFESVKLNEPALQIKLYEGLQPGSSTYKLSELTIWIPGRRVRVIDIELREVRSSGRLVQASQTSGARYVIEESSLNKIRAEMPTSTDEWEVERVLQYRCQYNIEQWLVKWKSFEEDRNTWEPWENLLSFDVQEEASKIRDREVHHLLTQHGPHKVTVVSLKAALEQRGMISSGNKSQLVERLLHTFRQDQENYS